MSSSGLVLVTDPPFDLLADWFGFSYCTIRSSLVVPSIDFTVQARIQYSLILFMWYILYIFFLIIFYFHLWFQFHVAFYLYYIMWLLPVLTVLLTATDGHLKQSW